MKKIPEYCEINDTHLKNIFHPSNYPWGETRRNLKKCCFYTFLFIYSVDFHGGNPRKFSDSTHWNPLAASRMFVARKDKIILFIHGPETKNFSSFEMITLKIEFTSCVCINFVLMLSYEREKVDKRQTGYLAKINRNETYFEYMKALNTYFTYATKKQRSAKLFSAAPSFQRTQKFHFYLHSFHLIVTEPGHHTMYINFVGWK